jgi:hypothetical protein
LAQDYKDVVPTALKTSQTKSYMSETEVGRKRTHRTQSPTNGC